MTSPYPQSSPTPACPDRFLPLLLILFFGSGCAALIYEIVWLQLLQLVIGSSAVSLGLLLGTFMGGMCLGSLSLARIIPARCHPLRVYAFLELGMAALGLTVLFAVPAVGRIYAPHAGQGFVGVLLRGMVASICLLPPTFLMGATLPAISRWVKSTAEGVSWLGSFYGANTAGAVVGCLLAGFYLLRVHDMPTATMVAAAINALVALAAFGLAALSPHGIPAKAEEANTASPARGCKLVYMAIALSGMTALAAEVICTRLLSLILGATVYTFSIILAVFLAGLGIGSLGGALFARRGPRPEIALGWCQILLTAAMAWACYMLTRSLPFWPINPSLARSPWYTFQLDLARSLWALLPATVLWGASFPLALAAVAARGMDPGRLVGRVYAANTLGAIIGALATSLLLIAWIGTQNTQRVLIGLSTIAGLALLFSSYWLRSPAPASDPPRGVPATITSFLLVAAIAFAFFLVWFVPPVPWQLIAYGRYISTYDHDRTLIYVGEGLNASVAVTQNSDGVVNFHISGKIEASTDPLDMRLQRMLGHLPGMIHTNPTSVLVVGCGAGVTAGSFLTYSGITNITICEIEPLIPTKITPYFEMLNYEVVKNRRVKIVYDDARHFVLTSHEKFDIITSDPIHPWVKGAATLYTEEYFQMCREHLKPGGIVTQWVPLYESDLPAVQSEMATFFKVFPDGTIWNNNNDAGAGYDTVVLGTAEPLKIDLERLHRRWRSEPSAALSLTDVGFDSANALMATYGGQAPDLKLWLAKAQINDDCNLRLQYLAGLASDLDQGAAIADSFLAYRKFPDNIFVGEGPYRDALRRIVRPKSKK